MNYLPLSECMACGGQNLELILDLGSQPLANSFKKTFSEKQEEYPLALNVCNDCFHCQLTHTVNPDLLFKDYLYVSGTTKTQLDYFEWFTSFVNKYVMPSGPKKVLDIGCNDGSQLNAFLDRKYETYGVDPAENLYEKSSQNHNVHCGYFTGDEFGDIKFDVVLCQNAFAHNTNQLELLRNIKRKLAIGGVFFGTVSQAHMIENGEFDTMYHEHLSFFNINSFNELCKRAGLNLIDVQEHEIHGGTLIFIVSAMQSEQARIDFLINREKSVGLHNKEIYQKFADKAKNTAQVFKEYIEDQRNAGAVIVGFGAPAKGNTFMNYAGIGPDFIIDENPLKQGMYTPGLSVPVYGVDFLEKYKNTNKLIFVPLAWNFYNEIIGKIKTIRPDKNDTFFRYYPYFEETK